MALIPAEQTAVQTDSVIFGDGLEGDLHPYRAPDQQLFSQAAVK